MTPDSVLQLMRTAFLPKVRDELELASIKDQNFYEKFTNLFERAQREECKHRWETLGDPPTHQRCLRCGKTLLIPSE